MSNAVRLQVTHSVLSKEDGVHRQETLALATQICSLKDRFHRIFGTRPQHQKLQLKDEFGAVISILDDDDSTLGIYAPSDGMTIHVIDIDPFQTVAGMQDVSKVEKFTLSEEEYNQRHDTFRQWKAQNLPKKETTSAPSPSQSDAGSTSTSVDLKVGARCQVVIVEGGFPRRGTVAYVGLVDDLPGVWVAVKFDEPVGKNDGSVKGKRYFDASPKYGSFCKPESVQIGDFPEESFEDDDDEL